MCSVVEEGFCIVVLSSVDRRSVRKALLSHVRGRSFVIGVVVGSRFCSVGPGEYFAVCGLESQQVARSFSLGMFFC